MTERLYYKDSHIRSFSARLCACRTEARGFAVILDRSAFFPGGGGQLHDTGTVGGLPVLSVYEEGDELVHLLPGPLTPGDTAACEIDWDTRLARMQNHSGEHILSGIVNRLYGFCNVGFHMGADAVTVDFDGYLDTEMLCEVERLANRAVYENRPVTAAVPPPCELETLDYRSKLDLAENVRIVTVEGVDACACCAPHVKRTGEIGLIKILDSQRHDGGVRLSLLCGTDAFEDYRKKAAMNAAISVLLSAKAAETDLAVRRLFEENEAHRRAIFELRTDLAERAAAALSPTEGNLVVFEQNFTAEQLRIVVNAGRELTPGLVAAFSGCDGAFNYVIGSRQIDLRARAKEINAAILGRGGGRTEMIEGRSGATEAVIRAYFGV